MTHHTASARQSRPRFRYISETVNELKKVVWLTRREIFYLTGLVLVVAAIFAVFLGTLDYVFSQIIDTVFLGG